MFFLMLFVVFMLVVAFMLVVLFELFILFRSFWIELNFFIYKIGGTIELFLTVMLLIDVCLPVLTGSFLTGIIYLGFYGFYCFSGFSSFYGISCTILILISSLAILP